MIGKRVVFTKPKQVEIQDYEVPSPSKGQVLIRTKLTLISTGTELTALSGNFSPTSYWATYVKYPFLPGYSNYGVVEEVGKETKLNVGDRVVSSSPHAQYVVSDEAEAFRVPDGISDEEAPFFNLAATVMNSIRLARVSMGEAVVVVGLGILGQLACQFARVSGAYPVMCADISGYRLELAKRLGANAVIKGNDEKKWIDDVRSITRGRMADAVFEVTGNPDAIPHEIPLLKRQGRLIILSSPRGPTTMDFHDLVNAPSTVIMGTHATSQPTCETPYNQWTMARNVELFFEMLLDRMVSVKEMVSEVIRFEEAREVYERLSDPFGYRLNVMATLLDFR